MDNITLLKSILLLVVFSKQVCGHYCEWDLCLSDQYCCGDNLCCQYVYSLWYFWVGIVFVVLLVSACVGLFRYHWRRRRGESRGLLPPYNTGGGGGGGGGGSAPPYAKLPTPGAGGTQSLPPHGQPQYHYQIMTNT